MRKSWLIASVAAVALAACHSRDEAAADDNAANALDANVTEVAPAENLTLPPPAPVNATNAAEPNAPPPEVSDEQQTQDDADATGMTARVARGDETNGSDTGVPVEQK